MTNTQKINLFCILEDIQDLILTDLTPDLRHSMKQWARKSREASRRFIKDVDKILSDNSAEQFGIESDEIYEMLIKYMER